MLFILYRFSLSPEDESHWLWLFSDFSSSAIVQSTFVLFSEACWQLLDRFQCDFSSTRSQFTEDKSYWLSYKILLIILLISHHLLKELQMLACWSVKLMLHFSQSRRSESPRWIFLLRTAKRSKCRMPKVNKKHNKIMSLWQVYTLRTISSAASLHI